MHFWKIKVIAFNQYRPCITYESNLNQFLFIVESTEKFLKINIFINITKGLFWWLKIFLVSVWGFKRTLKLMRYIFSINKNLFLKENRK